MKVLASWPATGIIQFGVTEILSTILLCYVLAVINGHVPAWLPMISDCAVYAPEKYPFRLGLVIGASLLSVQVVTTYYANKELRNAKLLSVLGVVASAGLAVVGVVNEKEDGNIHDFSAVVFFVGYDIYMVLTVYAFWFKEHMSSLSFIIKWVFAVTGNVALVGYLSGKYFIPMASIYLALFEWGNMLAITFFLWSAVLDELKNCSLSEIAEDVASGLRKKSPVHAIMKDSELLKPMLS